MPYQAPNVVTPPFPEYVSGHSTFSAAGAYILTQFTGSDTFGASVTIKAGRDCVRVAEVVPRGRIRAVVRRVDGVYGFEDLGLPCDWHQANGHEHSHQET